MLRRAKPVRQFERYDLPETQAVTIDGVVADAIALSNTRPSDDAFVQMLGEGQVPPGHIWPIAFARKPLDFWGEDNLTLCWDRLRSAGFDPTPDSGQIVLAVQAFEEGETLTGAALRQLHLAYSMGLVGIFCVVSSHDAARPNTSRAP